jgi:NDP-sugar pyrophosphorylase family protein
MTLELVVMAAGMGSRFGGLKQLEAIGPNGETVMDYALYDAHRAGIERVVFVIRRDFETLFKEKIGSRYQAWMDIQYAYQEVSDVPEGSPNFPERSKPWGTGQAGWAARHIVKHPFIVINADDFYGFHAFQSMVNYLKSTQETAAQHYALVAFNMHNTLSDFGRVSRGVCLVDAQGYLTQVTEYTRLQASAEGVDHENPDGSHVHFHGDEPVSMNFWGFHPSLFAHLETSFARFLAPTDHQKNEFFLPSVIDELVQTQQEQVRVLLTPDPWFGITYPDDKAVVQNRILELIEQGIYPRSLCL